MTRSTAIVMTLAVVGVMIFLSVAGKYIIP
jgi:hypothetical protein